MATLSFRIQYPDLILLKYSTVQKALRNIKDMAKPGQLALVPAADTNQSGAPANAVYSFGSSIGRKLGVASAINCVSDSPVGACERGCVAAGPAVAYNESTPRAHDNTTSEHPTGGSC